MEKAIENHTTIIWHGNLLIKKSSVEIHNCRCSAGKQPKKQTYLLKSLIYIIRHSVKNNYEKIFASNQYHQSN